ncbi:MAG: hypothetical protein KF690_11600 [Bacteroidetes bacterium]|nr:hypothetical protein [Bacteroidota bacterium]
MVKLKGAPLSQPIEAYCQLVDEALSSMENVRAYRIKKVSVNQWVSLKGSAFTLSEVTEARMNGATTGFLQSISPFCHLPAENTTQILLELMRYNHTLPGAFFGIADGYIVLKMIRELQDLDKGEIINQLQTVAYVSDMLDNQLIPEFGLVKVDVNIELVRQLAHLPEIDL